MHNAARAECTAHVLDLVLGRGGGVCTLHGGRDAFSEVCDHVVPRSLPCCLLRADTGYRERSEKVTRGGRGNGERPRICDCAQARPMRARAHHRQRVLRARTAVGRAPDMDANGFNSIHQLEQLSLKFAPIRRATRAMCC